MVAIAGLTVALIIYNFYFYRCIEDVIDDFIIEWLKANVCWQSTSSFVKVLRIVVNMFWDFTEVLPSVVVGFFKLVIVGGLPIAGLKLSRKLLVKARRALRRGRAYLATQRREALVLEVAQLRRERDDQ